MKIKTWLSGLLTVALLITFSTTGSGQVQAARSGNSVYSQLGIKGVTEKIYGADPTLYADYLVKLGTNGQFDLSVLPEATNTPIVWNKVFFIDSLNGGDEEGLYNGTSARPYLTFTNALQHASNDYTFIFAPGTYAPPTTVTNESVTNITLIALQPENTDMTGQLKFGADIDIVLNIYGMTLDTIRQQDYKDLTVGLYNRTAVTLINRQYPAAVNSVLTVYRDPSATLTTTISTTNSSEILTHSAADMAYTPALTNNWWPTILTNIPINIAEALDSLASRSLVNHGTSTGQISYWNGEFWEWSPAGATNTMLFGGTNPMFRAFGDIYSALDVPYTAANTNDWLAWFSYIPTNVADAFNYAADYAVPKGTNTGQMARWDGTNWLILAHNTTNTFLRGGNIPAFSYILAQDATYEPRDTNEWLRVVASVPSLVSTAIDDLAAASISIGTNVGQVTYWNGSEWTLAEAGPTNYALFGGATPSFEAVSLTLDTNSVPYNWVPGAHNAYDIGQLTNAWRNGYFGTDVYIAGTNVYQQVTNLFQTYLKSVNWETDIGTTQVFDNITVLSEIVAADLYIGSVYGTYGTVNFTATNGIEIVNWDTLTNFVLNTDWSTALNTTQTFDNITVLSEIVGTDLYIGSVYAGDGTVNFTATGGIEIVNYDTSTNLLATLNPQGFLTSIPNYYVTNNQITVSFVTNKVQFIASPSDSSRVLDVVNRRLMYASTWIAWDMELGEIRNPSNGEMAIDLGDLAGNWLTNGGTRSWFVSEDATNGMMIASYQAVTNLLATLNPQGFLTVESDPIWGAVSNSITTTVASNNTDVATLKTQYETFLIQFPSNNLAYPIALSGDSTLVEVWGQTRYGTAAFKVSRRPRATGWDDYTDINSGIVADTNGVGDTSWDSAWYSNDYRIVIVFTNVTVQAVSNQVEVTLKRDVL